MTHFIELVKSCQVAFQEDRTSVVTSNDISPGMSYYLPLSLLPPLPECGLIERKSFDVLEGVYWYLNILVTCISLPGLAICPLWLSVFSCNYRWLLKLKKLLNQYIGITYVTTLPTLSFGLMNEEQRLEFFISHSSTWVFPPRSSRRSHCCGSGTGLTLYHGAYLPVREADKMNLPVM